LIDALVDINMQLDHKISIDKYSCLLKPLQVMIIQPNGSLSPYNFTLGLVKERIHFLLRNSVTSYWVKGGDNDLIVT